MKYEIDSYSKPDIALFAVCIETISFVKKAVGRTVIEQCCGKEMGITFSDGIPNRLSRLKAMRPGPIGGALIIETRPEIGEGGIVRQSKGTISVDSTPGKGSVFGIVFSLSSDNPVRVSSVPPNLEALKGTETVLVVEDEAMLLSVVARLLRSFGYNVLTASQPGDALLLCEKQTEPIDLLLVDVVMPRMNGSVPALRLHSIHPEMRVLYMSGYSDFTVVKQVMNENLDRFISKPFCAEEPAAKVREVLARPL